MIAPPPPDLAPADRADDFAAVLETCRRFLLAIANDAIPARLAPKGGPSDLVQETLAAAFQARHQFRGQTAGELRAWLRGILHNELAQFRRRYLGTEARDVGREVPLPLLPAADEPAAAPAGREDRLADALGRLPAEHRRVVLLRFEEGLTFRQIGDCLGCSEDAARKLFGRAVERLRTPDAAA